MVSMNCRNPSLSSSEADPSEMSYLRRRRGRRRKGVSE